MEQTFWAARYETDQTGWNIGKVSTPIKAYLDQLENKELKILIPGCGFGYEAIYAHQLGFKHVFVLDFVAEPLKTLKMNCPDFPEAHMLQADFFKHEGTYDLILEQTLFCAINPEDREKYAQKAHQLLQPKGKLVGVLFNRSFESGPPFGGSAAEYEALFGKYFEKISIEECYNSISARQETEVFVKFTKELEK